MTTNEFIGKQEQMWSKIAAGEALEIAAIETHRKMANRIFNEGGAKEGQIGQYNSTDPIYINPAKSPKKFTPQGKYGDKVHKNKQPYKTRFFPSYKNFRQTIGRPTDKVNLNLSSNMERDFVTGIKKVNNLTWVSAFKRPENVLKKRGAERHFKKPIFSLTKGERELFIRVMNRETQRILHA